MSRGVLVNYRAKEGALHLRRVASGEGESSLFSHFEDDEQISKEGVKSKSITLQVFKDETSKKNLLPV
ncbi:unnamed protein product [Brassica oleracea]|uniref:(rape) hypothetical protein n=1 Tax=Brassica napus TaxID=3708 RepID=A0A816QXT7_BRANA|nr:unnamed protein product [Brassica napus]